MLDDPVQPARAQLDRRLGGRHAPAELRAPAADAHGAATRAGGGEHGCGLFDRRRVGHRSLTCAPRRPRARADARDRDREPRRTAAGSASPCRGWRARAGRTRTAAGGTPRGRRRENIAGMYARLSTPTPCSPVIEPPSSTHVRRSAGELLGALGLARAAPSRSRRAGGGCRRRRGRRSRPAACTRTRARRSGAAPAKARARDHAVLDVVGRRDPAHRRERGLARLPDQLALAGARAPRARRARRRGRTAPSRARTARCTPRAGRRARRSAPRPASSR